MTCARCRNLLRAKAWRRGDESRICAECIADAACAVPGERVPFPVEERLHVLFHTIAPAPDCWFCRHQVAA